MSFDLTVQGGTAQLGGIQAKTQVIGEKLGDVEVKISSGFAAKMTLEKFDQGREQGLRI